MDFIWRYFGFGAMYRWQNIIPITKEYDKYSFQKVDVYLKERIGKNMSIKKITLFFVICFFTVNIFAQSKKDCLEELRKADQLEYKIIGYAPHESLLYKTAEKFVNLCSEKEIVKYLNDENPIVRCYVVYFLSYKEIKADWYKILLKELSDYQNVAIMEGDLGQIMYAGDFFFDYLFSKLSDSEQAKIKLIAIQQQSKLYFAKKILLSNEKSDDLYSATRQWALKENDTAIYALAKYNKTEDLELINKLKELNPDLFFKACIFKLNKETNPYIAIPIYKYLISLNDKSINDYLIKTYNKNKNKYPDWALDQFDNLINSIK